MKVRLRYLDKVLFVGVLSLFAAFLVGSAFVGTVLKEKALNETLENITLTTKTLTDAVGSDLGLGDYRQAWRHLRLATAGTTIEAFQLTTADGTDLVGDIDAARKLTQAKSTMTSVNYGDPTVAVFTSASNDALVLTTGVMDVDGTKPFKATFLISTKNIPRLLWFFRYLALACSAGMILTFIMLFLVIRNRFALAMSQANAKISAIIHGDDAVSPVEGKLDDYFNSLSALKEFKSDFSEVKKALEEKSKAAAVASMTSMLAHDVRKPFSILKISLEMLAKTDDQAQIKKILSHLIPEVDLATNKVDGMLADVMEVSSTSTDLIQEPTSPEALIENVIGEIFRVYPNSDVAITYDLQHRHMVNVHVQKVARVFSNIVGNAVQAMVYRGKVWFKTREVGVDGKPFIEFCVGNAGSCISAENLPKLFNAFFTSGKKGGTGLGLAIAEKVVKAHGGSIWCESAKTAEYPDGYVEFSFTLPALLDQPSTTTAQLPAHSSEITKALEAMAELARSSSSPNKGELQLEAEVTAASGRLGRAFKLLVIDDETVYRRGLASALSRTPEFSKVISLTEADGSKQALELIAQESYDLVISDIDMGPTSLDGFELLGELKKIPELNALICVHSNRIVPDDQKRAITCGADAFILKPIERSQLLKLILQAAMRHPECKETRPAPVAPADAQLMATKSAGKPEVAVIEDNFSISMAWEDALGEDSTPHFFDSPEQFWARVESDPEFITRLRVVITDHHFDNSAEDGLGLAKAIKMRRPDLKILLCSSGAFSSDELAGCVDHVIAKRTVKFADLPA